MSVLRKNVIRTGFCALVLNFGEDEASGAKMIVQRLCMGLMVHNTTPQTSKSSSASMRMGL